MHLYFYPTGAGHSRRQSDALLADSVRRYRQDTRDGQERAQPSPLCIRREDSGRPFLSSCQTADEPLPFISLAHSGEWTLCAVASDKIGVDLERIRTLDALSLANRFFTAGEIGLLAGEGERERSARFFQLDTQGSGL